MVIMPDMARRSRLNLLGLVCLKASVWTVAWGSCGFGIALLSTMISPDTGHIPHGLVALIGAFVSAITGLFSGIVYALVSQTTSSRRSRVTMGAVVGRGDCDTTRL
jgi:hypothetical protein